jgi:hypothetical protein
MSFAMFAAPFNENVESFISDTDNTDNIMNKKRQTHNKTQKKYPKENFDSEKVNSVLEQIHNNSNTDDNESRSGLGDFNPPPKPQSAGVNKTISTEQMMNMTDQNNSQMFKTLGRSPQPNYENSDNLDLNDYSNYGDKKSIEEYYKRILPGYNPNRNPVNKPYYNYSGINSSNDSSTHDILLQKLNYMITLLENQQDEKTNNVTEEVVLYSFLGIFIIFVVDSFARVGKYVR